jgi:hypothetical protein
VGSALIGVIAQPGPRVLSILLLEKHFSELCPAGNSGVEGGRAPANVTCE